MTRAALSITRSIICPHGGQATLSIVNTNESIANSVWLLEPDVFTAAGGPFTTPEPNPSPCIRIGWSSSSNRTTINSTSILKRESVGLCYNVLNIPQKPAMIVKRKWR